MTRVASVACAVTVACALLAPGPAKACGGFFCNAMAVDQAGEQIAFVYEADGSVTTVVQIRYSGPSEEFAWVVPVQQLPRVELGTAALFAELDRTTRPTWALLRGQEGRCRDDACSCAPGTICLGGAPTTPHEVDVVERSALGPYEVAILSADDAGSLRRWLADHGYVVGAAAEAALADYIASGHHFVALRLRQDAGVGDLQPIVLRSASREPCIPLRLTAIAATPDMPVTVYVLADRRARPWSWLLIEPDFGDLGFWQGTLPYADLVTRAVDGAGGHAFVTDFAGPVPTDAVVELDVTREQLAASTSFSGMLSALGAGSNDPIAMRVVSRAVRSGSFDPVRLADELEAAVLVPRRAAQRMLDMQPWLTRLSTTVSPEEMTEDPTFGLSDELPPEHSRFLTATLVSECTADYDRPDAPTHLALPNGAVLPISEGRRVEESSCPSAPRPTGGCSTTGQASPLLVALPLAFGLLWRRRRGARASQ